MRLATIQSLAGPTAAAVVDGHAVPLPDADPSLPRELKSLLALGPPARAAAAAAVAKATVRLPLDQVKLLPPVPNPGKIIGVGLNYRDHALETGKAIPAEPVLFAKFSNALLAPGDPIVVPKVSNRVDFEAELVIVVGRGGRHIPEATAFAHVAGYTVGHDVSARDWQYKGETRQWLAGKTFDTFAPTGPWLVTADELTDPHNLPIQLRLNGTVMQDSSTAQLIFGVPQLLAYISQIVTLEPGDLIFTGTPPGVGDARKPPVYLKPGDVAEVEVGGIGVLRNPVVGEA